MKYIITISLIFNFYLSFGQDINLYHKYEDNMLWLRWECESPSTWYSSNQLGYRIVIKNKSDAIILDSVIMNNTIDYISEPENSIEKTLYYLSNRERIPNDLRQRWLNPDSTSQTEMDEISEEIFFALSSQKFEYLQKSGLAISVPVDFEETFTVIVQTNDPTANEKVEEVITPSQHTSPSPPNIKGKWSNKQVELTWSTKSLSDRFLYYNLYKSYDGSDFSLSDSLIINFYDESDDERLLQINIKQNLIANDTLTWFRLKGVDYFGKESEIYSEIIGAGRLGILVSPFFEKVDQLRSNEARMKWRIPDSSAPSVEEFRIYVSETYDGPYIIDTTGIDPETRTLTRPIPFRSAYFRVVAVDRNDEEFSSFPQLVVSVDTLAPEIPHDLKYEIDTTGKIRINWTANDEDDFIGYKLFYGFDSTSEMTLAHNSYLVKPEFLDTLELKTTKRDIFYKAISVDKRNNRSDFSKILHVVKPDILAPVEPQFIRSEAGPGSISLQWYQSISDDVVEQRLFRKQVGGDDSWELLEIWNLNFDTTYIDQNLEEFVKYAYTLTVSDEAGNISDPCKPMMNFALPDLRGFNVEQWSLSEGENVSVKISHAFTIPNIENVMIYRQKEGEELYLLAELRDGTIEFVDKEISKGIYYSYAIKVLFDNGIESPLSNFKNVRL